VSQIAQVQITFVAAEDRLLLRFATDQQEEFRFWLTRRFVKALRPNLGQSLTQQPHIKTQANPDARRELVKLEHEQAVAEADFKTPFRDAAKTLPLGEPPMLLTRFQLRPAVNDTITLSLGQENGVGIDLALNSRLLHSVVALVDTAILSAEWGLASATPRTAEAPADSVVLN
jgi:hypothetical protein